MSKIMTADEKMAQREERLKKNRDYIWEKNLKSDTINERIKSCCGSVKQDSSADGTEYIIITAKKGRTVYLEEEVQQFIIDRLVTANKVVEDGSSVYSIEKKPRYVDIPIVIRRTYNGSTRFIRPVTWSVSNVSLGHLSIDAYCYDGFSPSNSDVVHICGIADKPEPLLPLP